jgi:hypothetical protein
MPFPTLNCPHDQLITVSIAETRKYRFWTSLRK